MGGVADEIDGMQLDRDNFNFSFTHAWTISNSSLNQLSVQAGQRKFAEPNNTHGDRRVVLERQHARDRRQHRRRPARHGQDLRSARHVLHADRQRQVGAGPQVRRRVAARDRHWDFPVYPKGWLIYAQRPRLFPYLYIYGKGDGRVEDHDGPDFVLRPGRLPAVPAGDDQRRPALRPRHQRQQPGLHQPCDDRRRAGATRTTSSRAPAFSWDLAGNGRHVVRGGVGLFTGRFLLVPAHFELAAERLHGPHHPAARQRRAHRCSRPRPRPEQPAEHRHRAAARRRRASTRPS